MIHSELFELKAQLPTMLVNTVRSFDLKAIWKNKMVFLSTDSHYGYIYDSFHDFLLFCMRFNCRKQQSTLRIFTFIFLCIWD
jgi:hypothetical protein